MRNVAADDDLSRTGHAWRIVVAVVFVVGAAVTLWAWSRRAARADLARRSTRVLCAWTVGFWAVRGTGIALDDHEAGFVAVHAALMVVSIGLALWAWPRTRESVRSPGHLV